FEERYSLPTLNHGFFQEIAQNMGDQIVLVFAYDGSRCVAGAILYRSQSTLYGRHWGALQHYDSLHFEACYYQGISYAIEQGLKRFEPGAQGEHKIWRGFLPTLTYSYHSIVDPQFSNGIEHFLQQEAPAL
ncbi:MAG: GNAT family N-acetyltransferase, partial [Candidatus Thiodiazotropha sp. 6PLUC3]